ncbi:MAG TPA: hypothetical protein VMZ53_12935 [Kofleriaceae bacterium]|nr:hypothetical protein [Kofleriaceae bacterium]
MVRLLVASALFAAAASGCVGEEGPDYRPLELGYLTQSVFAPTCGATQCHSTFKQAATDVFDTPDGVRRSLVNNALVRLDPAKYDPDDAKNADLIIWITQIDPFGAGIGRMPYDAPMPNRDVKLLIEWIEHDAPGAQCNPELNSGKSCTVDSSGRNVVANCSDDWNFDLSTAIPCTSGCAAGQCL